MGKFVVLIPLTTIAKRIWLSGLSTQVSPKDHRGTSLVWHGARSALHQGTRMDPAIQFMGILNRFASTKYVVIRLAKLLKRMFGRYSFSLRTLFLSIGIACVISVVLLPHGRGLISIALLDRKLRSVGVYYVHRNSEGNVEWISLRNSQHLVEIASIPALTKVKTLDLSFAEVDPSLAGVKQFSNIQFLDLSGSDLDKSSCRSLEGIRVKVLRCCNTRIDVEDVEFLLNNSLIESIDLTETTLVPQQIEILREQFPRTTIVYRK
jgi:hypothetical protein